MDDIGHSVLLKYLLRERITKMEGNQQTKFDMTKLNPKLESEVPGEQHLRGDVKTDTTSDGTDAYVPVLRIVKTENGFTKGDVKLQNVTVNEHVSETMKTELPNPLYTGVISQTVTGPHPVREDKMAEPEVTRKHRTRIPVKRFRETVSRINEDRRKSREDTNMDLFKAQQKLRRSSIPVKKENTQQKPDTNTKENVPNTKKDITEKSNAPEQEFDKLFEELTDRKEAEVIDETLLIETKVDPVQIERSFERIVQEYDSQPMSLENTRYFPKSKIPLSRQKSYEHPISDKTLRRFELRSEPNNTDKEENNIVHIENEIPKAPIEEISVFEQHDNKENEIDLDNTKSSDNYSEMTLSDENYEVNKNNTKNVEKIPLIPKEIDEIVTRKEPAEEIDDKIPEKPEEIADKREDVTGVDKQESKEDITDISNLKGRVNRMISEIDETKQPNITDDNEVINLPKDVPKKQSILSKIALFEKCDPPKSPIENTPRPSIRDATPPKQTIVIEDVLTHTILDKPRIIETVLKTPALLRRSSEEPKRNKLEINNSDKIVYEAIDITADTATVEDNIQNDLNDKENDNERNSIDNNIIYDSFNDSNKNTTNLNIQTDKINETKKFKPENNVNNNFEHKTIDVDIKKNHNHIVDNGQVTPKWKQDKNKQQFKFSEIRSLFNKNESPKPVTRRSFEKIVLTDENNSKKQEKNIKTNDSFKSNGDIKPVEDNDDKNEVKRTEIDINDVKVHSDSKHEEFKTKNSLKLENNTIIGDRLKRLQSVTELDKMNAKKASVVENELGEKVKGKVNIILERINNISSNENVKRTMISSKEIPKSKSVFEKINMFERYGK